MDVRSYYCSSSAVVLLFQRIDSTSQDETREDWIFLRTTVVVASERNWMGDWKYKQKSGAHYVLSATNGGSSISAATIGWLELPFDLSLSPFSRKVCSDAYFAR